MGREASAQPGIVEDTRLMVCAPSCSQVTLEDCPRERSRRGGRHHQLASQPPFKDQEAETAVAAADAAAVALQAAAGSREQWATVGPRGEAISTLAEFFRELLRRSQVPGAVLTCHCH